MKSFSLRVAFLVGGLAAVMTSQAAASIILRLDQGSLINTSGSSWSIDLVVDLDNMGDPDLTSPPKVSSINARLFFSPVATGLDFVNAVAPSSGAIFAASSPTYASGSPDLNSELFASVVSSSAAVDPLLVNGGKVFTVNFTATPAVSGTHGIQIDPSMATTFFTLSGGGGSTVAFDSVSNATFTPTAVPEPSSLTLCAVIAGMAGLYARRKRFRIEKAAQG